MTYTKYPWTAGKTTPINATNLNHIEDGIYDAHELPRVRCATMVVAASDSLHPEQADYVCPGSADDVTIQSAIDAAIGNIVFMPGIYLIESELNLKRGVSLIGENSFKDQFKTEGTVFKLNANVNMFNGVVAAFGDQHLKNCAIKNITLDGNNKAYSAIKAQYMHELTLSEVQFRAFLGDAIDAAVCWDWRIRDCEFSYCGMDHTKHVIDVKCDANGSCNSWTLSGNRFEVNNGACLYLDSTGGGGYYNYSFKVVGNKFHGFSTPASRPNISTIQLDGKLHMIIGNEIIFSKTYLVDILSATTSGILISNNTFQTSELEAIRVQSNKHVITGNYFESSAKAGGEAHILLDTGADYNTVSANPNWNDSAVDLVENNGGAHNNITNNPFFNPVGYFTAPSLPATGVAYTNAYGYACMVSVYGGTVTDVVVDGHSTGHTSGTFHVASGETIAVAYNVAPTWGWWGL